ncbi:MAG: SUMF1/EgtB/PvdO family nonheme iron enzyme, partial [candidate division KSB1 bacterium]|nr:SUMF1/EgtB/PvdO family nonheme iron enzyme [candidate division KSB1 bacterium]
PGGQSPYGCEEMSGNVWDWTRSLWGTSWEKSDFKYPYKSDDGREDFSASSDYTRVLRGGAFGIDQRVVRCAYRYMNVPHFRHDFVGFRVVLSPPIFI